MLELGAWLWCLPSSHPWQARRRRMDDDRQATYTGESERSIQGEDDMTTLLHSKSGGNARRRRNRQRRSAARLQEYVSEDFEERPAASCPSIFGYIRRGGPMHRSPVTGPPSRSTIFPAARIVNTRARHQKRGSSGGLTICVRFSAHGRAVARRVPGHTVLPRSRRS